MKKFSVFLSFFIVLLFSAQNYHQYVNPLIGTGGHGHTFPGATVPFGMVQLSPDTRIDGSWDGASGYHYSDSVIYGFSHTHLNGTGVSDYCDMMMMPTMDVNSLNPKDYSSSFSHQKEKATAGYYSVHLDKYDIGVELTASKRVGFHKYTFNKAGNANIILDLNHRDKLLDSEIKIINDKNILVYRKSESWATNQQIWVKIEFNQPMNFQKVENKGIFISKNVKKGEQILAKVSLSFTGFDGAELNSSEIKDWDFDSVKKSAEKLWDKELAKIEVKSDDKDKLTVFYTALYHCFTQPNVVNDLDGNYMGMDKKIHKADGFEYYSVFSLWDTFRAYHPLMTLIDKKLTSDFINTFIKMYEQGGKLPVWELAANETECMIGYHSVSVIADAMMKGIKGFDYEKAYEASKNSAMLDIFGLDAYKMNGFIAIDDEHESVSKTLEYAYDDWCIAQMAKLLGKNEDYQYFMTRSQSWKNLFDPETHLMRPKKNGAWLKPFDGREVNNNYTEGNSWQYSFFVPQDINGLIEFYGGKENFEKKLDEMFSLPSATTGREQVDITGLIGQYAHGNEPSHHVAYLYNFVGKPEKTKEKVHFILDNFYKNSPDGLIGNEDCGQMSAWYILSSMGIYNVTPAQNQWETVEPYFDKVKVNFEDGTSEIITKKTPAKKLKYFGFDMRNMYCKINYEKNFITVPYFEYESQSFGDKMKVEIKSLNPKDEIIYQFKDAKGKEGWERIYKTPIEISSSTNIIAKVADGKKYSKYVSAQFYKKPNNYSVTLISKYNPQYHAGGKDGLVDGIYGSENWRKGDWQGYQSQDFEAIIDLKETKHITEISSNYLQDSRSWILFPTKVEYYVSANGKDYFLMETENISVEPFDYEIKTRKITSKILPTDARFVKVKAYNFGKLPEGHQGFEGDAFIFVDEIEVK
ncbi:MAG: GH92 family glycosyl hydrolase [Bergeyella sp.]